MRSILHYPTDKDSTFCTENQALPLVKLVCIFGAMPFNKQHHSHVISGDEQVLIFGNFIYSRRDW
jgi:hypothetical protein